MFISGTDVGKCVAQHHNIVEAAKRTGVKWIIYTSIIHADTSSTSHAEEHRITELELESAGIPFTILRNGWYTENYINSILSTLNWNNLVNTTDEVKIASAARADFADAAVAVLATNGHKGKIYELAGDNAYSLRDVIAEISRQVCKYYLHIHMLQIPHATSLANFSSSQCLAEVKIAGDVIASVSNLCDDNRQLSKLIGRPTTSLSASVAEVIKGVITDHLLKSRPI